MNFVKLSAQNDVCSFGYSTSASLVKTDTGAFNFNGRAGLSSQSLLF